MVEYYGSYTIVCDAEDASPDCWNDLFIYLDIEHGETKDDAIKFVTEVGWEILEDNYCLCPICAGKGLTRKAWDKKRKEENKKMRLVKNEKND